MQKIYKVDNKNIVIFVYISFFLLSAYPLLSFKYPVLVDYINHLASFYIQANVEQDKWLKENYTVKWIAKPYLIVEGYGGILAKIFDIFLAGRIVLISGITFICAGSLLIRKQINGNIDLWTCSIYSVIYNYVFFWGFVNYYVSSGLALVAIGLWIKLRNICYISNVLIFSAISLVLYFGHLYALGIYTIFVLGYEIGLIKQSDKKLLSVQLAKALSQFILPSVTFLVWWTDLPKYGVVNFYNYGDLSDKIIALLSPIAFDYSKPNLLLVIFILISIVIILFYTNRIKIIGISIYSNMKTPLLFILFAIIVMPNSLAGTWGTDFRYPYIFTILLFLSIKFDNNNEKSVNFRKYLLTLAFIATSFKIYYIIDTWKKVNTHYQEFADSSHYIKSGAKMLTIMNTTNTEGYDFRHYLHMPALYTIHRSTFWPPLFTINTPIYPTAKTEHIDTAYGSGTDINFEDLTSNKYNNGDPVGINAKIYWENWVQDFDYLISLRFNELSTIDHKNLHLLFKGSFFDIYKIIK